MKKNSHVVEAISLYAWTYLFVVSILKTHTPHTTHNRSRYKTKINRTIWRSSSHTHTDRKPLSIQIKVTYLANLLYSILFFSKINNHKSSKKINFFFYLSFFLFYFDFHFSSFFSKNFLPKSQFWRQNLKSYIFFLKFKFLNFFSFLKKLRIDYFYDLN